MMQSSEKKWTTYLVRCADRSLYCGISNDLQKRIAAHNAGTGARYTRSRRPVECVWAMESVDKRAAMSVEAIIKKMSKSEKEKLVLDGGISFVMPDGN